MRLPSIIRGDITQLQVDAIVNAANEWLLGGGGVDGAIHAAAGPELLDACRAIPQVKPGVRCPVGEARITPGFKLPSAFVIHTVGPRWRGGIQNEPEHLASCYRASLTLAHEHGLASVAFPAISTGVYGYPVLPACRIAVAECTSFLARATAVDDVMLVAFSTEHVAALRNALNELQS